MNRISKTLGIVPEFVNLQGRRPNANDVHEAGPARTPQGIAARKLELDADVAEAQAKADAEKRRIGGLFETARSLQADLAKARARVNDAVNWVSEFTDENIDARLRDVGRNFDGRSQWDVINAAAGWREVAKHRDLIIEGAKEELTRIESAMKEFIANNLADLTELGFFEQPENAT